MGSKKIESDEPHSLLNYKDADFKTRENNACDVSRDNSSKCSWTPVIFNVIFGITFCAVFFPISRGGIIPKTGFFCKDPTISYKHRGDTVGNRDVILFSCLLPIFFLAVLEPLKSFKISKGRLFDLWFLYADYLLSSLLCWVLIILAKVTVGSPRPDFLDFCQPDLALNCTPGEYVENFECQRSQHPVMQWMSISSFFSGHSAISVYAAIFSMYLVETRLSIGKHGSVLKITLESLALIWGAFVSCSRYMDRRHHWWDVIIGVIVGILQTIYTVHVIQMKYNLRSKEISVRDNYVKLENRCSKCLCKQNIL